MASIKKTNRVATKPKRRLNADDTLTAEEAKKVRRGIQQINEGRFKLWRGVKHELGS